MVSYLTSVWYIAIRWLKRVLRRKIHVWQCSASFAFPTNAIYSSHIGFLGNISCGLRKFNIHHVDCSWVEHTREMLGPILRYHPFLNGWLWYSHHVVLSEYNIPTKLREYYIPLASEILSRITYLKRYVLLSYPS